jgi:hypothetical protein
MGPSLAGKPSPGLSQSMVASGALLVLSKYCTDDRW